MDIFLLRPFYALIVNTSITAIRLAIHQRIILANPLSVEIIDTKNDERSQHLTPRVAVECVNVVHFNPTPDSLQQMESVRGSNNITTNS